MLFWLLSVMLQLFLLRTVWAAVYGDRDSLDGIEGHTLLVYLTISALHTYVLPNDLAHVMEERISTGRVATDIVRPIGFMRQMAAMQVGFTLGFLPIYLLAVPVAMLVGSLRMPDPGTLPVYLVSLVLAYVVNTLIWLILGLTGFWLLNAGGLRSLMSLTAGFLSGALVPLWFMPDAIRVVIRLLPFQAVTFLPASIFVGETRGMDALQPILVQVAWIGILLAICAFTWSRAQRKLVIQGG
jgi:ABC-type uncharacterized transport system permease subunit